MGARRMALLTLVMAYPTDTVFGRSWPSKDRKALQRTALGLSGGRGAKHLPGRPAASGPPSCRRILPSLTVAVLDQSSRPAIESWGREVRGGDQFIAGPVVTSGAVCHEDCHLERQLDPGPAETPAGLASEGPADVVCLQELKVGRRTPSPTRLCGRPATTRRSSTSRC